MKRIKKKHLVIMLMTFTFIFQGCKNDETDELVPPELPPMESMVATIDFPSATGGRIDGRVLDTQTRLNFANASLSVFFWQTLLAANLAIPVASFHEAFNHSFEYLKDEGRWLSEYTVPVGQTTVTASLYGELIESGTKVNWEMYLSVPNLFDDFLWYSGQSNTDKSGGTWILYKNPDAPVELLQIDWVRVDGTAIEATYTQIEEGAVAEGSFIHYGESDEAEFTHFYEVLAIGELETIDMQILVNQSTKVGRVKSMSSFGDDNWHCWDGNLDDVDCE